MKFSLSINSLKHIFLMVVNSYKNLLRKTLFLPQLARNYHKKLNKYLSVGAKGERYGKSHLKKLGYEIWEMNWRAKKGEIDIIASNGDTLVFVEVKTRHARVAPVFDPIFAVTEQKSEKLVQLISDYKETCKRKIERRHIRYFRLDIIGLIYEERFWMFPTFFLKFKVRHIQDALR